MRELRGEMMLLSESWFMCVIHSIKVTSGLEVSVSASVLVGQMFDSLPDLPRPGKLVLQSSYQVHGARKCCREHQ